MHKPKDIIIKQEEPFFPVIGVGASAGGLDAFKKFVEAIPESSGMAYILVQHMNAEHESALSAILSKSTKLPVNDITDNVHVQANNIYVIPPGKLLIVQDGALKLSNRNKQNKNIKPIDLFFTSLGVVHQNFAVGVVLSGSATDGTLGLKVIKAYGGLTFAQDEASAAFESMPNSAIKAGVVDFVLPPEKIPAKLVEINQPFHAVETTEEVTEDVVKEEEDIFRQIITLLRLRKAVDFTYYKQTTIKRRIVRRMALNKITAPVQYLNFLRENKNEQDALYDDMLISVTNFFRDEKYFEILCDKALPFILKQKTSNDPIRIWVVGCATGEEAYSMAICIHEFLNKQSPGTRLQIFATDISDKAIAKARKGEYSLNDLEDVSAERLQKYFTKANGNFQINKTIRELCVFAHHNVLKDPPFAKMEIISCRNVLIYMEPVLQKKVLTTFHYALKENGFLILGKSETTSSAPDLFTNFIEHDKIYLKKGSRGRFMHVTSESSEEVFKNIDQKNRPADASVLNYQKIADQVLLSRYTPAGVVINDQFDIIQFRGATGAYLDPSPGDASLNLMKMAKDELVFELRNLLHKVKGSQTSEKKEDILMHINNTQQLVSIEAVPLPNTIEPYFLILFQHKPLAEKPKENQTKTSNQKENKDSKDLRIEQLEKEIVQMREDMRNITEEQAAANEELQSANEELLSSSEELQSLNEELETAQEELQSTNEELNITNHELIDRNEQLNNARSYAESVIETIHEPLLILTADFIVKTATENYYKAFHATAKDTEGKLLFDLNNKGWDIEALHELLEKILPGKTSFSNFEITQNFKYLGERTMRLNARQIDNQQLILLAIEDITAKEKEKIELFKSKKLLEEKTELLSEAVRKLERSNQNLEQFAYVASHDLQEPLRKIKTFAARLHDTAKNEKLSNDEKIYLNKIVEASNRMSTLINELLSFSKLSNTQNFVDTDLNEVLNIALKDLELVIQQKKAKINSQRLPVIHAIPLQMNQLFYNLINNALKFSKDNTQPVLHISCEIASAEEKSKYPDLNAHADYCKISFADNGIGFEQEMAEKVFDIFQRLVGRSEYPGTGIGLALCRKIVSNHQGVIFANSHEDKGTVFHVILPYKTNDL